MIGRFLENIIAAVSPAWAERRAAARLSYEELSAYAAGSQNRLDPDWRPRNVSADAAILSDFDTILPRARDVGRNNWAGRSILKAFGRNVIGCGIVPAAVAKDAAGKERRDFNERRDFLFNHWASRAKHCDLERKQTFWRKQRMAVEEMVGAGQHFIAWSYVPNPETVGLRLQSFEPEQLDVVKLVNSDNGNQVRRGIEIDENGAAVAYWFYPRALNDYYGFQPAGVTGSLFWQSQRIPADRVFHLFDQERTRQTHGVTWLAPVIVKIRDTHSMDQTTLRKARIESAIALRINRTPTDPRGVPGAGSFGLPARNAGGRPDNVSRDGGRQYQFEEAMVFEGLPGEDVQISPQQNGGSNYDSFMRMNLRAAGAGVGLSYDVVARDYDQGSYSSKRQGALEDRREYNTIQDLATDVLCQPVVELFTAFAILEGRIQLTPEEEADFYADQAPWMETEWLPDGFEWIDPQKEASAAAQRISLRLDTRKNIIGSRGGNWRRTFQQFRDEEQEADRIGLTLPDAAAAGPPAAGNQAEQDEDQPDEDGNGGGGEGDGGEHPPESPGGVGLWNPDQARGPDGKFGEGGGSSGGGASTNHHAAAAAAGLELGNAAAGKLADLGRTSWGGLKRAGVATATVGAVKYAWVKDKVGAGVAKLPKPLQPVVRGAWVGSGIAFHPAYMASQAAAERVAIAKGATPEQARKLRGVLAGVDSTTGKVLKKGLSIAGLPHLGFAAGQVPIASVSYLAYSTAKNPAATLKAAAGAVKSVAHRVGLDDAGTGGAVFLGAGDNVAGALYEAMAAHGFDDTYIALLSAALDATGDVRRAVKVADAAAAGAKKKDGPELSEGRAPEELWNPDQEREPDGKFGSGGDSSGGGEATAEQAAIADKLHKSIHSAATSFLKEDSEVMAEQLLNHGAIDPGSLGEDGDGVAGQDFGKSKYSPKEAAAAIDAFGDNPIVQPDWSGASAKEAFGEIAAKCHDAAVKSEINARVTAMNGAWERGGFDLGTNDEAEVAKQEAAAEKIVAKGIKAAAWTTHGDPSGALPAEGHWDAEAGKAANTILADKSHDFAGELAADGKMTLAGDEATGTPLRGKFSAAETASLVRDYPKLGGEGNWSSDPAEAVTEIGNAVLGDAAQAKLGAKARTVNAAFARRCVAAGITPKPSEGESDEHESTREKIAAATLRDVAKLKGNQVS